MNKFMTPLVLVGQFGLSDFTEAGVALFLAKQFYKFVVNFGIVVIYEILERTKMVLERFFGLVNFDFKCAGHSWHSFVSNSF